MNSHRLSNPMESPAAIEEAGHADAYRHAEALVRAHDRDRYYATLFAPGESRRHLFALYAFNLEIARVRAVVSDPLPGEVRLQWWRDIISGAPGEGRSGNPTALALLDTVAKHSLPASALLNLIEARTFDLYDDPMPTWLDTEGYCGDTASALIRLASIILMKGRDTPGAEAAGHAGVAFGLTGLLRNLPWCAAKGQVYIPKEVLEKHGVSISDMIQLKDSEGLRVALAEVRARARHHLEQVRSRIGDVPGIIAPAFLSVGLVERYLKAMETRNYNPFRTIIDIPDLKKLWILWRQARRALR
jgi:15-cis-phytoene synthase